MISSSSKSNNPWPLILTLIMTLTPHCWVMATSHHQASAISAPQQLTRTEPDGWTVVNEPTTKDTPEIKWRALEDDPNSGFEMKVSKATKGYVAVGFCPRWTVSSMTGCDIILGWVDQGADGKDVPHLGDMHAPGGNGMPLMDKEQNVDPIQVTEESGTTTLHFKRKWDTGDKDDDAVLGSNNIQLIWAWNDVDPTSFTTIPQHQVVGVNVGHTQRMFPLMRSDSPDQDENTSSSPKADLPRGILSPEDENNGNEQGSSNKGSGSQQGHKEKPSGGGNGTSSDPNANSGRSITYLEVPIILATFLGAWVLSSVFQL